MKIIVLFTKYREKGRINALFITVFCLLCFCPVPQLFKSCHLVCTICLTPMSECAWHNGATVLLSCSIYSSIMRNQQRDWHGARCHTYSPMKLFLGHMAYLQGGTWLFWLCGTSSTDLDLSSSEGCLESTLPSWLKESNFFWSASPGHSSPCKWFYSKWQVAWLSKSSGGNTFWRENIPDKWWWPWGHAVGFKLS